MLGEEISTGTDEPIHVQNVYCSTQFVPHASHGTEQLEIASVHCLKNNI